MQESEAGEFLFRYTDMYGFYTDETRHNYQEARDVINAIHLKKVTKPSNGESRGVIDKYLHQSVSKVFYIPETDHYLCYDPRGKRKAMFFVREQVKNNIRFADHLTFMINKDVKKLKLHFHETVYTPLDDNYGTTDHNFFYQEEELVLPETGYIAPNIKEYPDYSSWEHVRKDFIDLCRAHKNQRAGGKTGRGSRRVTSRTSRRSTSISSISQALNNLLLEKEVDEVIAFGFYREEAWHYTVTFKLSYEVPSVKYMGTHFVCTDRKMSTFEAALLEKLEQWHGSLDVQFLLPNFNEEVPEYQASSAPARRGGSRKRKHIKKRNKKQGTSCIVQ